MAVAAPTATGFSFAGTSNSNARVIDATSNFLLVFVLTRFSPTTLTVTYGGNSLTDLTSLQNAGTAVYCDTFYLASPPTGSNTLAVTLGTARVCVVFFYGLSGVDTTTPFKVQTGPANYLQSPLNPGTAPNITLAGATGDLAIDAVALPADTDTTLAVTGGKANTEAITQIRDNTGTTFIRAGSSTAPGGASVAMGWTQGVSQAIIEQGVMVAAAAAAAVTPRRLLMGVGA